MNEVNAQPMIDAINAEPDPYPALCSLVFLLCDRTHMTSDDKCLVLDDVAALMYGYPTSPRSGFTIAKKTKGRQKATL